jgi:hypothetical protein
LISRQGDSENAIWENKSLESRQKRGFQHRLSALRGQKVPKKLLTFSATFDKNDEGEIKPQPPPPSSPSPSPRSLPHRYRLLDLPQQCRIAQQSGVFSIAIDASTLP